MAHKDLVTDSSLGPLCIDCLADREALEELVEATTVESRSGTCGGCHRGPRVTYCFTRGLVAA